MNTRSLRMASVALAAVALAAMPPAGAASTGGADFTRYVAMGDSITAGFCSGSIISTCQQSSYPALIAQQVGITDFQQPLVSPPGLPGVLHLVSLLPVAIVPTQGAGAPININLPRPYNNMAIPGANTHDVLVKTASTSPNDPTDLVLRHLGGTQLQEGLALHPTFVTLWIGNNDALKAATSGIVIDGVTLTTAAAFEADFRAIANAIDASGAKMAMATVPDVTSIPFVTTLTRFVPNPHTGQPLLINGSPVPLIGVNDGDFVLLTAQTYLAQGFGIPLALGGNGQPLPDQAVLSVAEANTIRDRVNAYNAVITAVAGEKGAALVDTHGALQRLATNGIDIGGVVLTSKFLVGGVFSYDGVHPTSTGYAYVANLFIDAINAKFGGSIPEVNLYPFLFGASSAAATKSAGPGAFYFSPMAWDSLRLSLNVPSTKELEAIQGGKPPRHHHKH